MKITCHPDALHLCPDCESEHLPPVPCGMTWPDRMKSVTPSTDWMPAKNDSRQRGMTKSYYDDEPLKDMFGYDVKERREIQMDETKGFGSLSTREKNSPEHIEAVLGKPEVD